MSKNNQRSHCKRIKEQIFITKDVNTTVLFSEILSCLPEESHKAKAEGCFLFIHKFIFLHVAYMLRGFCAGLFRTS